MASDISDYAVIGDGETVALVSRAGSVDFLCWPRFDSDACMAALLGDESRGHWQIAPEGCVRASSRSCRGDTPVPETKFETDRGAFRVVDAATIAAIESELMEGGLVRRRPAKHDGRDEGVFLACSCWLADCYRLQGREAEAVAMPGRVIGVASDVGLLSKEFRVPTQRLIGNMPQALTHLGVVNTAMGLSGPVLQPGA